MKKQIFILAFFVLAIFANLTTAYGQCSPGANTPTPGIPYTYGVTLSGATNTTPSYLWWVTQDAANVLTGTVVAPGVDFLAPAGLASATAVITWNPSAIGQTFYLAVKYSEKSAGNCDVENIKVYEIKPINAFLLTMVGSDATGDPLKNFECAAKVTGIVASSPNVTYTYGNNTLYYKVTASGIQGDWRPSLTLPALAGLGQNYVSAEWDYVGGTSPKAFNVVAGNTAGGTFTAADANVSDPVLGTAIIIKVVVANVNYETLNDQAITVAVDGLLPTAYTTTDIIGGVGSTQCDPDPLGLLGKNATFTIQHRPGVAALTVPAGGQFLIKNP